MTQAFPKAEFIANDTDLQQLVDALQGIPHLAVDTESNSLYAYYEQVCLIQLSINSKNNGDLSYIKDYIIDPFTIDDMRPLGKLMASPDTEVIFHGAEYDIMSLKRDFEFDFVNIFDTHLAARTLGKPKVGLSNLLADYFGVEVDKQYQQANWGKRPLPDEQLHYAQMDTHYLLNLRHQLCAELEDQGYMDEVNETLDYLTDLPPIEKNFDEDGFWRIKDTRHLNNTELAILRELYLWREDTAARMNRPPFKVLQNKTLVRLAQDQPDHIRQLELLKGFPKHQAKRFGPQIFAAIERGKKAGPPRHRRSASTIPQAVLARYEKLRNWRKQKASERGVESDIIISKHILLDVAHQHPRTLEELGQVNGIGTYRLQKYGQDILKLLSKK